MNTSARQQKIAEIIDMLQGLLDSAFGAGSGIVIDVDYDLRRDGYIVCISTADVISTELLTEQNATGLGWKGRLEHIVNAMSRHMKSESPT